MHEATADSVPLIPLTVLTGFLGAGKTTVLNRILAGDHGLRIAVMVNDFGNLDIAEELIAGRGDGAVKLTNGCICCSIKEDLVSSVMTVAHRSERPQHIVLEASGVADPTGIATTLLAPVFRSTIRLDGVICVVDAQQFDPDHPEHDLILRQLMVADLILLNKVDAVTATELARIDRQIRHWLNGARILHTVHGNAPPPVLLSTLDTARRSSSRRADGCRHPEHAIAPGADNADGDGVGVGVGVSLGDSHSHSHSDDHDARFDVWYYQTSHALSATALHEIVRTLPASIYRIKGIARLRQEPSAPGSPAPGSPAPEPSTLAPAEHPSSRMAQVQGVGRRLHLMTSGPTAAHATGGDTRDTRLVVIGAAGSLDPDLLQALFDSARNPASASHADTDSDSDSDSDSV